jgi:hypothetical protein
MLHNGNPPVRISVDCLAILTDFLCFSQSFQANASSAQKQMTVQPTSVPIRNSELSCYISLKSNGSESHLEAALFETRLGTD